MSEAHPVLIIGFPLGAALDQSKRPREITVECSDKGKIAASPQEWLKLRIIGQRSAPSPSCPLGPPRESDPAGARCNGENAPKPSC